MKKCHICENEIEPFMSFGKMPIANGFIQSNDYSNEYFFDLEVAYCSICTAVQVPSPPSKEKMFHSEYPFFSGSSLLMQEHFDRYALEIQERYLLAQPDPFVVEIGCNDGILLKNFAKRGIRHLGVDPSENVVTVASKQGLNVTTDFFDPEVSRRIVAKY